MTNEEQAILLGLVETVADTTGRIQELVVQAHELELVALGIVSDAKETDDEAR